MTSGPGHKKPAGKLQTKSECAAPGSGKGTVRANRCAMHCFTGSTGVNWDHPGQIRRCSHFSGELSHLWFRDPSPPPPCSCLWLNENSKVADGIR